MADDHDRYSYKDNTLDPKSTYKTRLTVTNFNKIGNASKNLQNGGYRLRNTYYNFCTAAEQGQDQTQEKQQFKLHFSDFNESQRKFLVKCRESYRDRQRAIDTTDSGHSILSEKAQTKSTYSRFAPSQMSRFTQRSSNATSVFSQAISQFAGVTGTMESSRASKKRHTHTFSDKIRGFFHDDVVFEKNCQRAASAGNGWERRMHERRQFAANYSKAERRKLGKRECLVHPSSIIRKVWNLISVFPTLFTLLVIPMEFAFLSETSHAPKILQYGNFACDMFYMLDIVLNYHTGYYDAKKKLYIMNATLTSRHYFNSFQIWVDLFSAFSLDTMFNVIASGMFGVTGWFGYPTDVYTLLGVTRFGVKSLRLIKMLRFKRGIKYLNRTAERVSRQFLQADALYRFARVIVSLFLIVHLSAIVQWAYPMFNNFPADSWPVVANLMPSQQLSYASVYKSWTYDDTHKANAYIERAGPLKPEPYRPMYDRFSEMYVYCIVRSVSQMLTLGYGGAPRCYTEVLMVMISMLLGALTWGILLAVIITFTQSLQVNQDMYSLKMREIVAYATFKNLPLVSKQVIYKFFEMRWMGKVFNEDEIIVDLSPELRRKVLTYVRLPWLRRTPIFRGCSTQFLLELAYTMRDELYIPNQLVVSVGRLCDQIIFPYHGEMVQYIPRLDILEVLKPGIPLGEVSIVNREFWNGEVYSLGWTRALTLLPEDVRTVGNVFPNDMTTVLTNFKNWTEKACALEWAENINEQLNEIGNELDDENNHDHIDRTYKMDTNLVNKVNEHRVEAGGGKKHTGFADNWFNKGGKGEQDRFDLDEQTTFGTTDEFDRYTVKQDRSVLQSYWGAKKTSVLDANSKTSQADTVAALESDDNVPMFHLNDEHHRFTVTRETEHLKGQLISSHIHEQLSSRGVNLPKIQSEDKSLEKSQKSSETTQNSSQNQNDSNQQKYIPEAIDTGKKGRLSTGRIIRKANSGSQMDLRGSDASILSQMDLRDSVKSNASVMYEANTDFGNGYAVPDTGLLKNTPSTTDMPSKSAVQNWLGNSNQIAPEQEKNSTTELNRNKISSGVPVLGPPPIKSKTNLSTANRRVSLADAAKRVTAVSRMSTAPRLSRQMSTTRMSVGGQRMSRSGSIAPRKSSIWAAPMSDNRPDFNPTEEYRRGPALLAQSSMLQTMLVRRQSMALGAICATGAANLEDMEVFAHPEDHVDKHTQQQMELDEIKRADIANAMKKSRLENQNQALAKAATMGIAPELLGGDDMPGMEPRSSMDRRGTIGGRRGSHLPGGLTGRRESNVGAIGGGRRQSMAAPSFKGTARKMSLATTLGAGLTSSRRMSRKVSLVPGSNMLGENLNEDGGNGGRRNSNRRKSSVSTRNSVTPRKSRISRMGNEQNEENNDQFNYNVDESEGNRPSAVRYTVGGAPNVPESRQSLSTRNTLTNAGVTPANKSRHMLAQKVTAAIRMSQFSRGPGAGGGRASLMAGAGRRMSRQFASTTNLACAIKENESDDDIGSIKEQNTNNMGRKMSIAGMASQISGMGRRMSVDSVGIGIRESIRQSAAAITGATLTKDINEAIHNIAQPERTRSLLRNNQSKTRWSESVTRVNNMKGQSKNITRSSVTGLRISESKQGLRTSESKQGLRTSESRGGGLRISESKGGLRASESRQLRVSESKKLRISESKQLRISESKTMQRSVSQHFADFEEEEEAPPVVAQEVAQEKEKVELDEDGEEINYRTSQQFEFSDWSAAYQEKEEVVSNSSSEVEGDLFKEHSEEYDQEHEDRQD